MPAYTAPGHGTMMTGAYPAETGIIGNEWLDRATGVRITRGSHEPTRPPGATPTTNAAPTPPLQPQHERHEPTTPHEFNCRRRPPARDQRPFQSHRHLG